MCTFYYFQLICPCPLSLHCRNIQAKHFVNGLWRHELRAWLPDHDTAVACHHWRSLGHSDPSLRECPNTPGSVDMSKVLPGFVYADEVCPPCGRECGGEG